MSRAPWIPPALRAEIAAALERGGSYREIADQFGLSIGSVGRISRAVRAAARGKVENRRQVAPDVLSALADSLLREPRPSVHSLREQHGVSYSTVRKVADDLGVDLGTAPTRPTLPSARRFLNEQEFLDALPSDPSRWREIVDWHPFFYNRKTGTPLPSRAQAIIMAMARHADGSFRYTNADIANAVGFQHEKTPDTLLTQARAAGLPVPTRARGRGGATNPPGGSLTNRIFGAAERGLRAKEPMTVEDIATALGKPREYGRVVYQRLYQLATGRATDDPALMARAKTLLRANPTRKGQNTKYILPWLAASLGAPYAASRFNDDDGMI